MVKQVMNQYEPNYIVTPGEVLEYELDTRKMSKAELAKRTGLSEKHLIAIIKGTGTSIITPETAIKLERALGMPVQYWLNLEANYQAAKARADEQKRLEKDLGWLQRIPVAAMVKMGWLSAHKEKSQQLGEVLRFFGIASVEQWEEVWPNVAVAYRQHNKHEIYPEAVSAWLRKGELDASAIECQPFDKATFRQALDSLRTLTAKTDPAEFIPALQKLCADAGVAVVFVPALPKTGVSGATRWIHSDKAIIQLSLRYKTNDHLWFTFFHEAGHILLHGKKELFLEGNNGLDDEKEAQANEFAEQELLPRKLFNPFMAKAMFSKLAIQAFAKEVGIAPGIVVGQLQHKGLLPQNFCNELKVSYQWAHE